MLFHIPSGIKYNGLFILTSFGHVFFMLKSTFIAILGNIKSSCLKEKGNKIYNEPPMVNSSVF